jgi:hypothetical protein
MPIPARIRDWMTNRQRRRLEKTFAEAREREAHTDELDPRMEEDPDDDPFVIMEKERPMRTPDWRGPGPGP